MSERIRVLIADDHAVVRQGLRTFLEVQDDIEVVGEASDGDEAVRLVETLAPDIAVMDLVMPRVDGVEAIRRLQETAAGTRVLVLTSFVDDDKLFAAVNAGAAGYLLKDVRPEQLADAIRAISRGESLLHPAATARLMREFAGERRASRADQLTKREMDVLRLIAQGRANKEIALELGVAAKTIKVHVSNILAKLDLADRTQAALYAVREKLVDID